MPDVSLIVVGGPRGLRNFQDCFARSLNHAQNVVQAQDSMGCCIPLGKHFQKSVFFWLRLLLRYGIFGMGSGISSLGKWLHSVVGAQILAWPACVAKNPDRVLATWVYVIGTAGSKSGNRASGGTNAPTHEQKAIRIGSDSRVAATERRRAESFCEVGW